MKNGPNKEEKKIKRAIELSRAAKPAYEELYPMLDALFSLQLRAKQSLNVRSVELPPALVKTEWEEGFPLLKRWDFPIDQDAAEAILTGIQAHLTIGNAAIKAACAALMAALAKLTQRDQRKEFWEGFLQHELEPWEEWVDTNGVEAPALLFLARSALRPSVEWTAEDLLKRFPLPKSWFKGYCPICGSLPSLLFLDGEGERQAYCSWCGTQWGLHRLQCPYCDNRNHESLGYLFTEAEPHYRIQYCKLCKMYFKLIDLKERTDPAYFPLEEWTTLHLDLMAQRVGWVQPSSPSPAVYGTEQCCR